MNSKCRRYSSEFKIKAVELSKSRKNIGSELNISYETLKRWLKTYKMVNLKIVHQNIHPNNKKLSD